jgi:basic amino acid/polyamine antiporter, APA family
LGLGSLLALGLNGIVGVGIFFAPAEVAGRVPGPSGLWVYAVTALSLLPVAWTYATLGGHFDEDGGPYVWARAAFGPGLAFAVGWIAYVSAVFSTSAVLVGLSQYLAPELGFHGAWPQRGFILLAIALLSGIVALGLRPSAAAWDLVTVLKLVPLAALVLAFLSLSGSLASPPSAPANAIRLESVQRAMLVIVFALQGFEIVPVPAGHARNPRLFIPLATMGSLLGAGMLYVLIHAACVRALPNLAQADAPLVAAGRALGGAKLEWLMGIGTNLSAFGIALGMLAMTPRYLAALGRSDALGAWLAREDARRVPQRALWITVAAVLIFSQAGELGELFALSSVSVLAQYAVTAAALLRLGARRMHGLTRWQLLPAPFALIAIALIARGAAARELFVAGAVLGIGVLLLLARRRSAHVD